MTHITLPAYAKINLFLSVCGKRPDTYHDLDSVFHSITLSDTVCLTKTNDSTLSMVCNDASLSTASDNLCIRAAKAFLDYTQLSFGLSIRLQKLIPTQAGLGGGSADAASVLWGLNRLCGNLLNTQQLLAIGTPLGADIPFCLIGGAQVAQGIGERLAPCTPLPPCTILVVMGGQGISTKEAFAALDREGAPAQPSSVDMQTALKSGDLSAIGAQLYNSFEQITAGANALSTRLRTLGAQGACLSGSGAAVFGLFSDFYVARSASFALQKEGYRTYLCAPNPHPNLIS